MAENLYFILALLPVLVGITGFQLWKWRYKTYAHVPTLFPTNFFIGHMGYIAAAYKKVGNSKIHPGKQHFAARFCFLLITNRLYLRRNLENLWSS